MECISPYLEYSHLNGDFHKLSQVLRNLLSNALKFTPTNGTVIVKAVRVDQYQDLRTISYSSWSRTTGMSSLRTRSQE